MNNTSHDAEEKQPDSQSAAAALSEVNSAPLFDIRNRSTQILIFCLAIFVILVVFGATKKKAMPVLEKKPIALRPNYSAELAANEAMLKAEPEDLAIDASSPIPFSEKIVKITEPKHLLSKDMVARMNQPLSMYSAGLSAQDSKSSPSTQKDDRSKGSIVHANKIPNPAYTIASGEFIQATLETAINSHLPGMIRATITKPVYAYTGQEPLIPAGSRLIGQYVSASLQNQRRVMVIWDRVILPEGISVYLDSPGTGPLGRIGQGADKINKHFWTRFGDAVLLSMIGVTAGNAGVSDKDQYNSGAAYRMALAHSFDEAAKEAVSQNQDIKPTLHVHQGSKINVFVAKDLSFYDVLGKSK